MRRTIAVLALLFAATPVAAHAQSWSAFDRAFPLFPCQDGWTGCRVDGRSISPELQPDGTGALNQANQRLGWFDLEPTAAFSPFVPLSVYTGDEPSRVQPEPVPTDDEDEELDAVAQVDPVPVTPAPAPVAPRVPSATEVAAQQQARAAEEDARQRQAAQREAEQAAQRAQAEQQARQREAQEAARRAAELEAQAQAAADAQERERLRREADEAAARDREAQAARQRAEEERARQEAERQRAEAAAAEAERRAAAERQRAEAERQRAEEEAARQAQAQAQREAEERAAAEAAAAAAAEKAAAEKAAADQAKAAQAAAQAQANTGDGAADAADAGAVAGEASCEVGELVRLEPMAMLGRLSGPQVQACEAALAAAPRMTDKDKISRVLMGNAFSKGDKQGWERLVKRHLDEIDQSDPDLCYKYALHLSNMGPGRATGVIRWANVALENRTVWVGDTYTSRVNSLYKLRASAAQTLWKKAEEDFAANASEEGKRKMDGFRDQTKVLAREWFEYAKAANRDHTQALQLCMSAAGTSDYCEAR